MQLKSLWNALRHPIHPETRENLERLWAGLADDLRGPEQLYGRQWEGCGATIGAMPRCDFSCTACYLGKEANSIPPLALDEIRDQLKLIRSQVGRWGNVQLTDGEVALRPAAEVIELLRSARELELIPMLMTHGEGFRKRPELLERLVHEGGLSEISFHIDTTQRGRGDLRPQRERELHGVRADFAELVRRVRRSTGRELRVASTVTVTRDNLAGVAEIVEWMVRNHDVYRMLSFQPVASVGRTRDRNGVSREELWDEICRGLGHDRRAADSAWRSNLIFGHPECTHVVMGAVWDPSDGPPRFVPLRDPTDPVAESRLRTFFGRFGGLSFRNDTRSVAVARALGLFLRAPWFWTMHAPRWLNAWLRRADSSVLQAATRSARSDARLSPLVIVSHHFMDEGTLESPIGKRREAACVFQVPYRGELVSMCRINATGLRQTQYRSQAKKLTAQP